MGQRNLEELCQQLLKSEKLNDTDNLVLHLSLQGKTYEQIANSSGYNNDYIRDVGYRLWGKLSKQIGIKVNKKNVNSILKRYISEDALKSRLALSSIDWGAAPETNVFYGRDQELNKLKQCIIKERCNLVAIYGMGGIGKTFLASRLAKEVKTEFDFVIRLSLSNAPVIESILLQIIKLISQQQDLEIAPPHNLNKIIRQLLYYLYRCRCLLILEDLESILQIKRVNNDRLKINYKKEYQGYAQFLETIANFPHQSCILLTTREIPNNLVCLSRKNSMVYSLQLSGLNINECQPIIQLSGIIKRSTHNIEKLINYYAGNPLALKIVTASIVDLFNGDLEAFWQSEVRVFGEIEELLEQQWQSLSDLEKDVMFQIARVREPISFNYLEDYLLSINSHSQLLIVLQSLKRRSLIQRNIKGFTQEPFVMDYISKKFTESPKRLEKILLKV